MSEVQLVRLDPAIEESLINNPAYMDALIASNWAQVANYIYEAVGRTLTAVPLSVESLEWDGDFVVDIDTREFVGSCAFKGQPTEDGTVEISYFTYPDFEGKGYATLMARKLIELAANATNIKRVIAHTLPEVSASTRVLEKSEMSFVGEVIDPDDGQVWKWQTQIRE